MNNRNDMPPKKPLIQASHSYLEKLKGRMVTMYRGGPESKAGILLDVKSDYVALYTQNNNKNDNNKDNKNNKNETQQNTDNTNSVIYYQAHHLKSISEDTKNNSIQSMEANAAEGIEFIKAENFKDIISQLNNDTIQINQGGPESKQGMLSGFAKDCLMLFTRR